MNLDSLVSKPERAFPSKLLSCRVKIRAENPATGPEDPAKLFSERGQLWEISENESAHHEVHRFRSQRDLGQLSLNQVTSEPRLRLSAPQHGWAEVDTDTQLRALGDPLSQPAAGAAAQVGDAGTAEIGQDLSQTPFLEMQRRIRELIVTGSPKLVTLKGIADFRLRSAECWSGEGVVIGRHDQQFLRLA
jgi:hypothetical protein